jgi:hypothetical protein
MTVRELIKELEQCDDDIKDYEVGVIFRVQINQDTRISGKCLNVIVPDNADIDAKRIWIKAR